MIKSLSFFLNPKIKKYKIKLKKLELKYNNYVNEKVEIEKILIEFQHQHTIELGSLILKILKLRKEKYIDEKDKYEEAENDEETYRNQFETEKKKQIIDIDKNEKIELKKKFRKASTLCHPDKVSEENKEKAQEIFIILKKAYDNNDLKKVSEILENLEKNNFESSSDNISEIEKLKILIEKIEHKIELIIREIIEIQKSETYKTIILIEDWEAYFKEKKKQLKNEYDNLV